MPIAQPWMEDGVLFKIQYGCWPRVGATIVTTLQYTLYIRNWQAKGIKKWNPAENIEQRVGGGGKKTRLAHLMKLDIK